MPGFVFILASLLVLSTSGAHRSTLPRYPAQAAASDQGVARSGGMVSATVVKGSRAKPVSGISVHLVNVRAHFDKTQRSADDGTVQFEDVPFGAHYSLRVYDKTGRLIATDPDFSLTEADPLHVCIPNLDISRGQA